MLSIVVGVIMYATFPDPALDDGAPAATPDGAQVGRVMSNAVASGVGALMYLATLTEVPILEGLLTHGMGQGPALALLLAGPALSLPSILVVRSVLGTKRTLFYVTLVVVLSATAGWGFGAFAAEGVIG